MARKSFVENGQRGPGRRRHDWCKILSEIYFDVHVEPGNTPSNVLGTVDSRRFGSIGFSALKTPQLHVSRTPYLIANDKVEEFCFVFTMTGHCRFRQRGRQHIASTGQFYVVNAAEPYEVEHSDRTELVCLTAPSDLVRDRVKGIDDSILEINCGDPATAATLHHFVWNTLSTGVCASAPAVEGLCFQMIEFMFSRTTES